MRSLLLLSQLEELKFSQNYYSQIFLTQVRLRELHLKYFTSDLIQFLYFQALFVINNCSHKFSTYPKL